MTGNKVTFYSIPDLTSALRTAEKWHKRNNLPAEKWAEEYASFIFNTEGAEIVIPQADGDGREIENPCIGTWCNPVYVSDDFLSVANPNDPEEGGSY